jgi:hypothetical protein
MRTLALVAVLIITPLSIADDLHFAPPGEISIVVCDTHGTPLPGVAVILESGNVHTRNAAVITAADGSIQFQHLAAGDYFVTANLSGFFTQTTGPIPIVLDKSPRLPDTPRLPDKLRLVLNPGPYWIDTIGSNRK